MLTDNQLDTLIEKLKQEGVSYKLIANISDIPQTTFYFYRRCRHYPLDVRSQIVDALYNRFGDMIDELSK